MLVYLRDGQRDTDRGEEEAKNGSQISARKKVLENNKANENCLSLRESQNAFFRIDKV